jgi:TRAP-type mannitol/chloroaromatic compound transport system substrate-binding protein
MDHPHESDRLVDEMTSTLLNRRRLLGGAGVIAGGALLAACAGSDETDAVEVTGTGGDTAAGGGATTAPAAAGGAALEGDLPEIEWEMATSWPLSLDTIFGGAEIFAENLAALTGGRFVVVPNAGGELSEPLEVLGDVESGAINIGHTASYYYVGKGAPTAFGTALPFGLTSRQQNAWLYEGGGLALLQEYYADKFGVIQFPAGNTGVQMGGWFNKEINSVADLQGLKMRIPGLGGQVMEKLGVSVQVIAGGEIFQALSTGAIDAAEWVGPYDDQKLGFQDAAQFFYFPGWWEPGPTLEVQIGLAAWDELPEYYKLAVQAAARAANLGMMARYDVRNPTALTELEEAGVELRPFPDDVMQAARDASEELLDELAAGDADFAAILEPWRAFRDSVQRWHGVAESSYLTFTAGDA